MSNRMLLLVVFLLLMGDCRIHQWSVESQYGGIGVVDEIPDRGNSQLFTRYYELIYPEVE